MAFNKYDSVIDSPGNVFATLNPLKNWTGHGAYRTLSDGNLHLTPTTTASQYGSVDASILLPNSGKFYFEVYSYASAGVGNAAYFGIVKSNYNPSSNSYTLLYGGGDFSGIVVNYYSEVYQGYTNESQIDSNFTTSNKADIFSIIVDIDNSSIEGWYNGTEFGTWKTKTLASSPAGYAIAACVSTHSSNRSDVIFNFGQDHTFAGAKTDSAGSSPTDGSPGRFYYQPPEGAKALCSANLPMPIENPKEYFKAVTYTGNGSTQSITDVGFQPDLVWAKERDDTSSHQLYDSVRGPKKRLESDNNVEEADAPGLTSFDSSGFSLGSHGAINDNNVKNVAWCWKAGGGGGKYNIDGKPYVTFEETGLTAGDIEPIGMSVNTKAGFSIVKYNAGGDVPHGLEKAPDFIITKNLDSTYNWDIYHSGVGNSGIFTTDPMNSRASFGEVTDTTFATVDDYTHNGSDEYIAYCWHSVPGYSKLGSYTGNGVADGPFVYTGFKPAYVMVKCTTADNNNWVIRDSVRDGYNPNNLALFANEPDVEPGSTWNPVDILSNGFKVRASGTDVNSTDETYIYMAFAEKPLATQEQKRWKPKLFNIMDKFKYDGITEATAATSMQDIRDNVASPTSGVYYFKMPEVNGGNVFQTYCDFSIDGGFGYMMLVNQYFVNKTEGPSHATMNASQASGTPEYNSEFKAYPKDLFDCFDKYCTKLAVFARTNSGTSSGGIESAGTVRWVTFSGATGAQYKKHFTSHLSTMQFTCSFKAKDGNTGTAHWPNNHGSSGGVMQVSQGSNINNYILFEYKPNGGTDPNHYWSVHNGRNGDNYFAVNSTYQGTLNSRWGGVLIG